MKNMIIIYRIYEECFPLKKKKIHSKNFSRPWITPNILKLIKYKTIDSAKRRKIIIQTTTKSTKMPKKKQKRPSGKKNINTINTC